MFNDKYNLTDDFEIHGNWWVKGNKKNTYSLGVLRRKNGETFLYVETAYQYNEKIDIILGESGNDKISLYNNIFHRSNGNKKTYITFHCFIGSKHYNSQKSVNTDIVRLKFNSLNYWFSPGKCERIDNNKVEIIQNMIIDLKIKDLKISIHPQIIESQKAKPLEFTAKTDNYVTLTYDNKVDNNRICKDIWCIKTFIAFTSRMPCSQTQIQLIFLDKTNTMERLGFEMPKKSRWHYSSYVDFLINIKIESIESYLNHYHYLDNMFFNGDSFRDNNDNNHQNATLEQLLNNWFSMCTTWGLPIESFMSFLLNRDFIPNELQFLLLITAFESLFNLKYNKCKEKYSIDKKEFKKTIEPLIKFINNNLVCDERIMQKIKTGISSHIQKSLKEKISTEIIRFNDVFKYFNGFNPIQESERIKDIRVSIAHTGSISNKQKKYLQISKAYLRILIECVFLEELGFDKTMIAELIHGVSDYPQNMSDFTSFQISW